MSFGEWLELGDCNHDVAYALPRRGLDSSTSEAGDSPQPTNWGGAAQPEPRYRLAHRFFACGEFAPPTGWHEGLRQRWQELGDLSANHPSAAITLPEAESLDTPIADFKAAVEAAFERVVHEAEAANAGDSSEANLSPRYLGLILDPQTFKLRRRGLEGEVDFSRNQRAWNILSFLLRRRSGYTTREELVEEWAALGNSADTTSLPSAGTIDTRMYELRRLLAELMVYLRYRRELGYCLEPLQSS